MINRNSNTQHKNTGEGGAGDTESMHTEINTQDTHDDTV